MPSALASHATGASLQRVERAFIAALDSQPAGSHGLVFDVGANDGAWSKQWATIAEDANKDGKRLEVFTFEPQPRFAAHLSAMAIEHNFTFIAAAATKTDGTAAFRGLDSKNSKSGHLQSLNAHVYVAGSAPGEKVAPDEGTTQVRTIDLAAFVNARLPVDAVAGLSSSAGGVPSLMKLDVESAEYELLPWLLTQGALCRLSHLNIEWHLNMLPPERRLSALGLRLGFRGLLANGCAHPPRVVEHDEFTANNQALPVPGLPRVLLEHSAWAGKSRGGSHISAWTASLEVQDAAYFTQRRSEGEAAARHHTATCSAAPPRCAGSCDYEDLACSVPTAREAYLSMMERRLPVRTAGLFGDAAASPQPRSAAARASSSPPGNIIINASDDPWHNRLPGAMHCECARYRLRRSERDPQLWPKQPVYPD